MPLRQLSAYKLSFWMQEPKQPDTLKWGMANAPKISPLPMEGRWLNNLSLFFFFLTYHSCPTVIEHSRHTLCSALTFLNRTLHQLPTVGTSLITHPSAALFLPLSHFSTRLPEFPEITSLINSYLTLSLATGLVSRGVQTKTLSNTCAAHV